MLLYFQVNPYEGENVVNARNTQLNVLDMEAELLAAARYQDEYDLRTINLIAPASPTPSRYVDNIPLKHNAIAEGLLGSRPYAGAEGFNRIETVAVNAAKILFHADHANVQPHSVSQANQAVYQALLKPGDAVLAMQFEAGGHLTHGLKKNFSGLHYDFDFYGLNDDGYINYEEIERKAFEHKPKLIVCGASSYPREIEFNLFRDIARSVGAYLLADLSHPAGLIAADRFPQPFPECDVVTLTPDKTLLGPHGGIVLSTEELSSRIDSAIHPGVQSSVPLRRIYGTAQCLIDAQKPWFQNYIDRVLCNMKAFEYEFSRYPNLMISGGSSTHMMILDTYNTFSLTGKKAEELLENVGILTNRQVIPGDKLKPYIASGIRLGTSWITARAYNQNESALIAQAIIGILNEPANLKLHDQTRKIMEPLLNLKRQNDVWYDEA